MPQRTGVEFETYTYFTVLQQGTEWWGLKKNHISIATHQRAPDLRITHLGQNLRAKKSKKKRIRNYFFGNNQFNIYTSHINSAREARADFVKNIQRRSDLAQRFCYGRIQLLKRLVTQRLYFFLISYSTIEQCFGRRSAIFSLILRRQVE